LGFAGFGTDQGLVFDTEATIGQAFENTVRMNRG
jgi:hypothetical protein